METITSSPRTIISERSAKAERIMEAAKKGTPKAPETTKPEVKPEVKPDAKVLSKKAAEAKAVFDALSPEDKKAYLKEVKAAAKPKTMSRMDAVMTALLTKKPLTVKEWIAETNAIYGGENNAESMFNIRYATKVLTHLGQEYPKE